MVRPAHESPEFKAWYAKFHDEQMKKLEVEKAAGLANKKSKPPKQKLPKLNGWPLMMLFYTVGILIFLGCFIALFMSPSPAAMLAIAIAALLGVFCIWVARL